MHLIGCGAATLLVYLTFFCMVCLDCGQPATEFSSYCAGCRIRYRQHPVVPAGFWNRFITKSNRYTRQYNFAARPADKPGFFTEYGPLKLLFLSLTVFRKLMH